MKKLGRFLTTIALSAPLLSGCSLLNLFSNLPEEDDANVYGIELRGDYATSVPLNSKYEFGGQVYIVYNDKTDKEITSKCSFRDVDTSKVGVAEFRVDYETKSKIYYTTENISVYDPAAKGELLSISVSNYTNTVEKGAVYTFDGKVSATYSLNGVQTKIDVSTSDCTIGTLNTSYVGTKSLTISFTDTYNGKTTTKSVSASIDVIQKPTSVSANAIEVGVNRTKTISLSFEPSDTTEKDVTFTSNNTAIATVDEAGKVKGTGSIGQSTTITVTSKVNSSVTTTVNVSIVEVQQDEWTILMYVCGADLESASSEGGQATDDLKEIASVNGQPDDVNIVVQAGGASSWKSTYSSVINKNYRNRFHLRNKTYVSDSQESKVNMGLASSLQDFLTWGINTYPADKIGLIFWNHGGAMTGCCFDEQYSDDGLTPAEVSSAIKAAKSATGYEDKFEFIGYDCCLMQVQDIAGLNSEYANYQIASEESEWGYGWTYDGWIDDLYAKKSTPNILKAIVDSFASETESSYSASGYENDQTLSYLDLSKWNSYQTAWEDMSSTLSGIVNSSSKWNTLQSVINSCQKFGETQQGWSSVYPFDVFDVGSFCTKMKASLSYSGNSTLMSKISAVQSAYSNLIGYEWHGSAASGATGLTLFAPVSGYSSTSDYTSSSTPLSNWRSICVNYGSWN